jgi:hypothetical protein
VLVILPASPDSTSLRCQDCGRLWTVPLTRPVVDAIKAGVLGDAD